MNVKSNEKADFLWNAAAGLINASEAVVLSIVITRTNPIEDAGILSLAFAIGNLMMTIGRYGVRTYQVTERGGNNHFSDFYTSRIITVFLMLVVSSIYIFICFSLKQYTIKKTVAIASICLIYMSEALEDVFSGYFQAAGNLALGGKIFSYRWITVLGAISFVLIRYHNLDAALIAGLISNTILEAILLKRAIINYHIKFRFAFTTGTKDILHHCFPLFATAFLTYYVTNAPKYAIDRYLSDRDQAVFGFLFMPVLMIELMNNFIYQPILVATATDWYDGHIKQLKNRIYRQCLIIVAVSIFCLVVGALAGISLLSTLFKVDMKADSGTFLTLLVGGSAYAFSSYFGTILIIFRKQRAVMGGYSVIALLALLLSGVFVKSFHLFGAALIYSILMFALAVIYAVVILDTLNKQSSCPMRDCGRL